ncbi:flagellar M-ring protein FliF [Shewanella sp. D64]|uniref:flagellar basal-body MS-ring/collar protein FliF n=1 Tax=unclassified Shewanella TaxID=196818 RepID=UPI0022BA437D|nr:MULTISPECIES: flagellar basal-body MS-ring/collar protein FliF [unclassified Shewanella]MEC4725911.1 flagellar M-ring protein FliF [Shewanella sp. D64]MEC4737166.1 flagellar M-ring protein FliF [Shewanella sp. E94]WBJ95642.1 flagellar M-ring protein FliF [Shewanella sp. MTB7]
MSTTLTQPSLTTIDPGNKGEILSSIKSKWHEFNRGDRQVLILAILASVVACVIVLLLWTTSQGYRPLYGHQEQVETSQIIEVLETEGIAYRLDATSGLVLVQEDKLGKARMLLAAKGVKAKVPSGMESLDKAGIGTSQFMEQARYRHSLEGELARTIMALNAVRTARVHLAIPKRTLFIRQQPELPSASVMLDIYAGANLQTSQVEAVVNLVAGSVSGMTPERVQVVDQEGNLLSSGIAGNQDITQARDKQLKYTQELEQSLIDRASSMLAPVLGLENFQVQIAAQVNFNQVEETRESLDPQSVVTQEQQSINDTDSTLAMGIPGALSNQTPTANQDGNENSSRNLNKQESRQFDVGRSVKHTRFQQMQLENLSVSVLLNSQTGGTTGWNETQMAQLGTMVQDAIGFSAARGDQFSINSFLFAPVKIAQFEPMPWWQAEGYQAYLRYFIGAILGLGLIFFVLRPLVSHLTRTAEHTFKENFNETSVALEPPVENMANTAQLGDSQALADQLMGLDQNKMGSDWIGNQNLPAPGSPLTVKMEHLSLLANQEPARVAEVIAHWIGDKNKE